MEETEPQPAKRLPDSEHAAHQFLTETLKNAKREGDCYVWPELDWIRQGDHETLRAHAVYNLVNRRPFSAPVKRTCADARCVRPSHHAEGDQVHSAGGFEMAIVGAVPTFCTIEGCARPHEARGYCRDHLNRLRVYGDPLGTAALDQARPERSRQRYAPDATCAVDGCDSRPKSRGYCQRHYGRLQTYGDPLYEPPKREAKPRAQRKPKAQPRAVMPAATPAPEPKRTNLRRTYGHTRFCSLDGCDRGHYCKGYCATHYARLRKWGDPTADHSQVRGTCSVASCERDHYSKGYCRPHYRRLMKHGEIGADVPIREPGRLCEVDGCEQKHAAKGYCEAHYDRLRRYGDPLYQPRRPRQVKISEDRLAELLAYEAQAAAA